MTDNRYPLVAYGDDPYGDRDIDDLATQKLQIAISNASMVQHGIRGWLRQREANRIVKSVSTELVKLQQKDRAKEQPSVVVDPWEAVGAYRRQSRRTGIRQKTAQSFDMLCTMAEMCEGLAIIVNTGVKMGGRFSQHVDDGNQSKNQPGWSVKMCDTDATPTAADKQAMADIKAFVENCGFTPPPEDQKPVGWQPGFRSYMEQTIRNSLRMDWTVTRMWSSTINPTRYPVVSFAAEDARHMVFAEKEPKSVEGGKLRFEAFPSERVDHPKVPVRYLKLTESSSIGKAIEEYTANEMCSWVRNPRTDGQSMGYGRSESEDALAMISGWIFARNSNISRFRADHLPRGLMAILGAVGQQQLAAFQIMWARQYDDRAEDRWKIPIVSGAAGAGSSVQWIPIDSGIHDMEYQALMHLVVAVMHFCYSMSPAATGWDGLNPKPSALNEASPEEKLDNGENLFLTPLVSSFFSHLTENVVWRMPQWKGKYRIVPMGLGDYDELADAQTAGAQQDAGICNTLEVRAERDRDEIPILKSDPIYFEAASLPGRFTVMLPLVLQKKQLEMQIKQAEDAQKQQAVQAAQEQQQNMIMDSAQAGKVLPPGQAAGVKSAAPALPPGAPDPAKESQKALAKAFLL